MSDKIKKAEACSQIVTTGRLTSANYHRLPTSSWIRLQKFCVSDFLTFSQPENQERGSQRRALERTSLSRMKTMNGLLIVCICHALQAVAFSMGEEVNKFTALHFDASASLQIDASHEGMLVQHVEFGESSSSLSLQAKVREVLAQEGILAITNVPGLTSVREEALVASAKCVFTTTSLFEGVVETRESSVPVEFKLKDGSKRYTWGSFTGSSEKIGFTPQCPELQDKMEKLRSIVTLGTSYFTDLLDDAIRVKPNVGRDGLFGKNTHTTYSSFRKMMDEGKHLDHFHVYDNNNVSSINERSMQKSRQETLQLHTDQGLFIAIVPSLRVYENGLVDLEEDSFYIERKDGTRVPVKIPSSGNALVFMIGDGANQLKQNSIHPLRAVPHALSLKQQFFWMRDKTLRSWFGRMFFAPVEATSTLFDQKKIVEWSDEEEKNERLQRFSNPNLLSCGSPVQQREGGARMNRRVLHDGTGQNCSSGEVYCWMSCVSIESLPCSEDSVICQTGAGAIWEDCETCEDPSAKPVCATSAPTAFPEYNLDLGSSLHLSYTFNLTHGTFKLTSLERGYIGFGIGQQMLSSIAIIGMDPSSNPGKSAVGLYRITSSEGDLQSLATTSSQLAGFGITSASFSLLVSTSELEFTLDRSLQSPEFSLVQDSVNIIYAVGSLLFVEHIAFGNLLGLDFNFAASDPPSEGPTNNGTLSVYTISPVLAAHIVLMILAWEVFAPNGVLVALWNNAEKYHMKNPFISKWFPYHWIIQTIAVVVGYIGTLLGYLYVQNKGGSHWDTTHTQLGLAVLIMSILQPLFGRFRPAKPQQQFKHTKTLSRRAFEIGHPLLGYVVLFLGMINALLGVQELTNVSGNQSQYAFGAASMQPQALGFAGPIGIAVVVLFAVFTLLIFVGWCRILLLRTREGKRAPIEEEGDENGKDENKTQTILV